MPQGKGTYGSKVGRPSKKKYHVGGEVGGEVDPILEAAKMGQELKSIPLEAVGSEFSITNAPDRMETSPMGNEVGTGMYQLGGEVKPPTADYFKKGGTVKKKGGHGGTS